MSWDWIEGLQKVKAEAVPAALVTIIKTKGSTPREVGTKILITADKFYGTIGGGTLEELVIAKAREILKTHQSPERIPYPLCIKAGQCCGGFVEVFVETINTGPQLWIFGAGHVAQAIAKTLEGTPFQLHMVDPRSEWLEKTPSYVVKHLDKGFDTIHSDAFKNAEKKYCVVMTYEHDLDQDLIEQLSSYSLQYLGLIGSHTKWQRFQKRLTEKGVPSAQLSKVKCPIGIPLGGKSPQEVAISFAAELIQLHYQNTVKEFSSRTETNQDWLLEVL